MKTTETEETKLPYEFPQSSPGELDMEDEEYFYNIWKKNITNN